VATTNFLTKVNKLFDFIYYGLRLFCFGCSLGLLEGLSMVGELQSTAVFVVFFLVTGTPEGKNIAKLRGRNSH